MPALISQPGASASSLEAQLDAHLTDLLASLDVYATTHALTSESFSKGFMQLARARLSLGAHGWTSLGGDGWDARSVRAAVRVRCDEQGGIEVIRVKVQPEQGEAEDMINSAAAKTEKPQSDSSGLRRRGKATETAVTTSSVEPQGSAFKDEEEDSTGKLKSLFIQGRPIESKRKPSTDPIDQFAALPPPTLRSAQRHFREALKALLGATTTPEKAVEDGADNSLACLAKFRVLQGKIEAARNETEGKA